MASEIAEEKETRERILNNVKREVKQLMEVAAVRKFVHEDNGCVSSLCSAIEACLSHGLKRRAVGLFKTSTTLSLVQKISKSCPEAEQVVKLCDEYDRLFCSSVPVGNNNNNNPTTQFSAKTSSSPSPSSATGTAAGKNQSSSTLNLLLTPTSQTASSPQLPVSSPGSASSSKSFLSQTNILSSPLEKISSSASASSSNTSLSIFSKKIFSPSSPTSGADDLKSSNETNNNLNGSSNSLLPPSPSVRKDSVNSDDGGGSSPSPRPSNRNSSGANSEQHQQQQFSLSYSPNFHRGSPGYKFLWIRLALINKVLPKIVEHIVQNSSKFYSPFALVADPVDGPLFSSLVIGPCALEFTRIKSYDNLWNDPNADELIQRHKMHTTFSIHSSTQALLPLSNISNSANIKNNKTNNTGNKAFNHHLQSKSKTSLNMAGLKRSSHNAAVATGVEADDEKDFDFNYSNNSNNSSNYSLIMSPSYSHHHHHNPAVSPKLGLNASLSKRKASVNAMDDPDKANVMTLSSNDALINSRAAAAAANKAENKPRFPLKTIKTSPSPSHLMSGKTAGNNNSNTSTITTKSTNNQNSIGGGGGNQSPSYLPRNTQQMSPVVVMNTAKEYVESLHQNSKSQIIYGKNHVIVCQREKELAGYLSLHLNYVSGLILKWTPNQIMNAASLSSTSSIDNDNTLSMSNNSSTVSSTSSSSNLNKYKAKSAYWDYAMYVDINTIVYLHCHQHENKEATIVLVAQDGVQHPPIRFPKGSHLLQFLTCLESGLAPNGLLDPPLWNDENIFKGGGGIGKIFPKLQRKSAARPPSLQQHHQQQLNNNKNGIEDDQQQQTADFVFRIINSKSNVSVTDLNDELSKRKQQLPYSYSASAAALISNSNSTAADAANKKTTSSNIIDSIFPHSFIRTMSKSRVLGFNNSNNNNNNSNNNNNNGSSRTDGKIELASNSILDQTPSSSSSKNEHNKINRVFTLGSFTLFSSKSKQQQDIDAKSTASNSNEKASGAKKATPTLQKQSSINSDAAVDNLSIHSNSSSLVIPSSFDSTSISSLNGSIHHLNYHHHHHHHNVPPTPPQSLSSSISSISQLSGSTTASAAVIAAAIDNDHILGISSTTPDSPSATTTVCGRNTSLTVRSSMKSLCDNMKRQILMRAFYGWLAYHRHLKTVSLHLIGLVNCDRDRDEDEEEENEYLEIYEDQEHENENHQQQQQQSSGESMDDRQQLPVENDEKEKTTQQTAEKQRKMLRRKSSYLLTSKKLDDKLWSLFMKKSENNGDSDGEGGIRLNENKNFFYKMVYYNGIEHEIRPKVWPFLLEHYTCDMDEKERMEKDSLSRDYYDNLLKQWRPYEEFIKVRDNQKKAMCINSSNSNSKSTAAENAAVDEQNNQSTPPVTEAAKATASTDKKLLIRNSSATSNEVFMEDSANQSSSSFSLLNRFPSAKNLLSKLMNPRQSTLNLLNTSGTGITIKDDALIEEETTTDKPLSEESKATTTKNNDDEEINMIVHEYVKKIIDESTQKLVEAEAEAEEEEKEKEKEKVKGSEVEVEESIIKKTTSLKKKGRVSFLEDKNKTNDNVADNSDNQTEQIIESNNTNNNNQDETVAAEAATETAATTLIIDLSNPKDKELIDNFALNIHRIDKDVTRCDRNYWYFSSTDNLNKLRNIMYTYVWENLSIGYIQGMCDLVAPLLVIFDNEPLVYSCFKQLMKRMSSNFPHGTAMDQHFSNMRSLIQIMDSDLFEHMHQRGDYTHFFFSYRWFLLDFKRELKYEDVFHVWETIWAAKYVCSAHFHLFIALALVETYRDIIIDNNMDFTDIIKFFNEMAEKHNTEEILALARSLIKQLQDLINNNKDSSLLKFEIKKQINK